MLRKARKLYRALREVEWISSLVQYLWSAFKEFGGGVWGYLQIGITAAMSAAVFLSSIPTWVGWVVVLLVAYAPNIRRTIRFVKTHEFPSGAPRLAVRWISKGEILKLIADGPLVFEQSHRRQAVVGPSPNLDLLTRILSPRPVGEEEYGRMRDRTLAEGILDQIIERNPECRRISDDTEEYDQEAVDREIRTMIRVRELGS